MTSQKLSLRRVLQGIARRLWPEPQHVYPDDLPSLEGLSVVDLGCGLNPHPAATAVVEPYLTPISRCEGVVSPEAFTAHGVRFVKQPMDSDLPFQDKEFD
ncbi:MAG TPA: hypothetical protein VLG48_02525, partial [Candidatus Methylomirabilis sp.]|nr:hypothetical protein [Candidatus Methylomirabilis sp.]